MSSVAIELRLEPADNERLANLCGQFDENLRLLERRTGVEIGNRGSHFKLSGEDDAVVVTERVIRELYSLTASKSISANDVHLELSNNESGDAEEPVADEAIRTRRTMVRARGSNQKRYLEAIRTNDVCFGVGPAGIPASKIIAPAIPLCFISSRSRVIPSLLITLIVPPCNSINSLARESPIPVPS